MDLKVVCLLFGCLLSIALAQGEDEDGDGGSQEKGPSEECNCDRRRGGRGPGGRGWGRRGGKDGEKKCFTPFSLIDGCEEVSKQICTYFEKNREEMGKCKEMETFDDKRICMKENFEKACKSNEVEHSPACWSKLTELFGPE